MMDWTPPPKRLPRAFTMQTAAEALEQEIEDAHKRYERRIAEIKGRSKPRQAVAVVESKKLAAEALALRRGGKTFREIGGILGVCTAVARERCARGERDEADKAPITELSGRARCVLRNFLPVKHEFEITPELVAAVDFEKLGQGHNVGRVTLSEIAQWLENHGVCPDPMKNT